MEEPGLSLQRMALGGRGQAATGRSVGKPDLGGRRQAEGGGGWHRPTGAGMQVGARP